MGMMSFSHMALLLGIVLVIFGAGKVPRIMGDIAKGVKAFKNGIKEGEEDEETGKTVKLPDHKNHAA